MARSTYIYLVRENDEPVAAFTVKHEMLTWIEYHPGDYQLYRMADGLYSTLPQGKRPVEIELD